MMIGAPGYARCRGFRIVVSRSPTRLTAMTVRNADKKGYHFARTSWVMLFYDVMKV